MSATTSLPAVSIVMPCFNGAAHLPQSVGSVLRQTFENWELIVVDDGSTDTSFAWLESQTDARLVLMHQSNQGVSAARNAGLARARAEYVAFLDADDTWAPSFLERLYGALLAQPQAVLAYCGWQNLGLAGGRGQPFVPPEYETPQKREILFAGCRWPVHAALSKREAVLAAGGFETALKNAEDYALWLELAATAPIVRVPEVLAFYHFHGGVQASTNRARAALHLLHAQQQYLARHPDFATVLGRKRRRKLLYSNLLREGFDCYWKRDIPAARTLFRHSMSVGFGQPKEWLYMLPCLLPEKLHARLIGWMEWRRK